jgi:DNA ligase (NAD+)
MSPDLDRENFDLAVERAKAAAVAYYDSGDLLMTDAEYDSLMDSITRTRELHSEWGGEELETKVAAGQSRGGDVKHPSPMMSLSKVRTESELRDFLSDIRGEVVVEPKLDGMAVRAEYRSGKLELVATRGDGFTGEDVTPQALSLNGLPANLDKSIDMDIRGEVYMTDADFEVANTNRVATGKPAFVNPRNAVAGSLRKQDRSYEAPMSFAAYEVDDVGESYEQRMRAVSSLGIVTARDLIPGAGLLRANLIEVQARIDEIHRMRAQLGFPIDGAVIKVDQASERQRLGFNSHAPRWAVAFKYPADTATTTLKDIELAIGRTGRLSLRAVLEPVFVGGATVTYATLHHPGFVRDADLRIGDEVFVYRSGDVIPRVTAPVLRSRKADSETWQPPISCPRCGEPLDRSSLLWRCNTPSCSLAGRIRYFASRDVMDIEGLDEAVTLAMLDAGLVSDIADLYDLSEEQLANLSMGTLQSGKPRLLGKTVAAKLIAGIAHSKEQPLNRVITSLGIRGVGRSMGRRLASHFGSLAALRSATPGELAVVEGVGEIKAEVLFDGLREMSEIIDRMVAAGVTTQTKEPVTSIQRPLEGKKVVVTGTVPGLTRTQAQEAVEKLGGTSSSSVSNSVDLVVVGEGAGSKATKAAQMGIPVMDASEFAAMVEGQASTP